ncbi:AAA family ATPase [Acidovorax sp.]|uniref:AAA family ATPase n=1 Tax=Acidovorax sp. TaxID=1872122 RepID=UPI00391F1B89
MPAKIVTVFNQKGGVGKTTTTCQLAGTFGWRGYDVLVADMDPQQTTTSWLTNADEGYKFPATLWVGHHYGNKVTDELKILSHKYDLIFVDCAPAVDNPSTWASLLVSDLAIIPTKLTPADVTALPAALELAKKARIESGFDFPVRILGTAYRKNRADERMMLESISNNARYPEFTVLPIQLGDRVAFTRAMLSGATAHSMPKPGEAIAELDLLADSVCELLGIPTEKAE